MALHVNLVKCPECGASLPIEEGRMQFFCSYCGTKVVITNENEHVYRHVDEAGVKQAETERLIRMKQIELEEKRMEAAETEKTKRIRTSLTMALVGTIMMISGYTLSYRVSDSLSILTLVGLFALIAAWRTWPFSKKKKK